VPPNAGKVGRSPLRRYPLVGSHAARQRFSKCCGVASRCHDPIKLPVSRSHDEHRHVGPAQRREVPRHVGTSADRVPSDPEIQGGFGILAPSSKRSCLVPSILNMKSPTQRLLMARRSHQAPAKLETDRFRSFEALVHLLAETQRSPCTLCHGQVVWWSGAPYRRNDGVSWGLDPTQRRRLRPGSQRTTERSPGR